ncbi:alpha/beta hydrolase [Bosea sp. LC85]|uniref:alpha/beta hydrolase n=1 Tax=Bosea sp. LC85 TaxID=1502851 RepID=UPI000698B955|nr:alpha/beta hydrolase-fold protein [Bosea sp. LC85]
MDIASDYGDIYRLLIAVPPGPAPAAGFPVIYLVDGNALFATSVETAQLQGRRQDVTGVDPAVIVGIGYPTDAPFDGARRQCDLLPDEGGADRFLDFIMESVKPAVAALAATDPTRQALVGHSLGGLFALHALFTRPGQFQFYVAGSPSIWWNDRAIHISEARFVARGPEATLPRLLITVGGREQTRDARTSPERAQRLHMARMLDNAAEMAARLASSRCVAMEHRVFDGENHISVIPAMLARAVSFAVAGTGGPEAAP